MDKPPQRVCVFLLQLGGPEKLDDIEPFLRNLFEDVLPVPHFLRSFVARRIAHSRAPQVAPQYERMGGGSPLLRNTQAQGQALEQRLRQRGHDAKVLLAMRYAPPRASLALEEARLHWSDAEWVALPLYPQYSFATTRSSLDELMALLTTPEQESLRVVNAYPTEPSYIEATVACVREALGELPESPVPHILFSAHGLPQKLVRQGDPYPGQVGQTVDALTAKLDGPWPTHLSYQSRVGPVRWLEPATDATVTRLGQEGVKSLVVVPVSFVSEHIETLIELDVDLAATAQRAGITRFRRAPTPSTHPAFIDSLAALVERALP